ncbi:hypothetical protein AB6A40_003679 [Gnathostoma spinigerum]|uniref:G-protein coupled receptors family 1 profile domain-containing protein n=1 Tax=Gnathostoma spinigerum TaxID=75299 RepID=A0ABD6EAA2_9BILA
MKVSAAVKKHSTLTRTLSAILISYSIFWCLPIATHLFFKLTKASDDVRIRVLYLSYVTRGFYSGFNLVIYMTMHREFRNRLLCTTVDADRSNTTKVVASTIGFAKTENRALSTHEVQS